MKTKPVEEVFKKHFTEKKITAALVWAGKQSRRVKHSKRKLSPHQIEEFSALARKIDAEEGAEIREQAREGFRQHEELRAVVEGLKADRQRQGLSLADVARRCGISKPNLSRIENNWRATPKVETLQRYAMAMGKVIRLHVEVAQAA